MGEQLELKIKTTTVRKASELAFTEMDKVFSSFTFCMRVRKILNNHTMDGTILRRLRELRNLGKCVYTVKDRVNGIYEKA